MDQCKCTNKVDEYVDRKSAAQDMINNNCVDILPRKFMATEQNAQRGENVENDSETPTDHPGQTRDYFVAEQTQSPQNVSQHTEQENHIGFPTTNVEVLPRLQIDSPEQAFTSKENGGSVPETSKEQSEQCSESILNETENQNCIGIQTANNEVLPSSRLEASEHREESICNNSNSERNEENSADNHTSSTPSVLEDFEPEGCINTRANIEVKSCVYNVQREATQPKQEPFVTVIDTEKNIQSLPVLKSELNFSKEIMKEICREIFEGFPEVGEQEQDWAISTPKPVSKTLKRKRRANSEPPNIFYCANCSYSSKHKYALVSHMMSHRELSESNMYKCDICHHETKRKGDLKAHMIIHKDPAEIKLFYCANCPYKTKRKCDLKQHVQKHQDKSLYKCPHCSYQTSYKLYLEKGHMLIHMDESEVKVYKCDKCIYQTKIKHHLKVHLNTHKDPKTLPQYRCNWCEFQTTSKSNIRSHVLLVHTCPSELTMFKCDMCDFECKRKSGLRDHKMNIHLNSEKVYKCADCPFITKQRSCIRNHVKLHMDTSKVKMFNCDGCGFASRRKANLISHKKSAHGCNKS